MNINIYHNDLILLYKNKKLETKTKRNICSQLNWRLVDNADMRYWIQPPYISRTLASLLSVLEYTTLYNTGAIGFIYVLSCEQIRKIFQERYLQKVL